MKKAEIREGIKEELIGQVEGLINIDVGNYIKNKKHSYIGSLNIDIYIESKNGINVYITDDDFVNDKYVIDKYGFVEFNDTAHELRAFIGHYHYEDLLWLLMNYETEKKKMIDKVDKYFFWKTIL